MPSKDTQFKPGQSGNPAGKPKGLTSVSKVRDWINKGMVKCTTEGMKTPLEVLVEQINDPKIDPKIKSANAIALMPYFMARSPDKVSVEAHGEGKLTISWDTGNSNDIKDIDGTIIDNE